MVTHLKCLILIFCTKRVQTLYCLCQHVLSEFSTSILEYIWIQYTASTSDFPWAPLVDSLLQDCVFISSHLYLKCPNVNQYNEDWKLLGELWEGRSQVFCIAGQWCQNHLNRTTVFHYAGQWQWSNGCYTEQIRHLSFMIHASLFKQLIPTSWWNLTLKVGKKVVF